MKCLVIVLMRLVHTEIVQLLFFLDLQEFMPWN